jgi:pyruvate formate lyase activating enzyme
MDADETIDGPPAQWWRREADGRLLCEACPRACRLQEGQRGLCFVRARKNDSMVLTTYGRSSGFCIDPIEKKPLNHFLPGTSVLSFGTAGCNLACSFCQNWSISKSRETETIAQAASPESIARAAKNAGCASVAYTYNDPVIFAEYAIDIAAACREAGVKSVAVTAGYVDGAAREALFAAMDGANVDLKAFSDRFYDRIVKGRLSVVLDTLEYLRRETNVWFEITTLLIPDENDSDAELDALSAWVCDRLGADTPLHFSAFHPDFRMRNKTRTPHETLIRARRIAKANGLRHVYVGNVLDEARASTWCHACGEKLVGRARYELTGYALDETGACAKCGAALSGVFAEKPGAWGNKRQKVRIAA